MFQAPLGSWITVTARNDIGQQSDALTRVSNGIELGICIVYDGRVLDGCGVADHGGDMGYKGRVRFGGGSIIIMRIKHFLNLGNPSTPQAVANIIGP